MSLSHTSNLCRKCSKVDLGRLSRVSDHYTGKGFNDEFWNPTKNHQDAQCPLCRLVFKTILEDGQITKTALDEEPEVCGRFTRHECLLVVHPKKGDVTISSYSIQLSPSKYQASLQLSQGFRKVVYDHEQLSSWLEDCSTKHQQCQPSQHSAGTLPTEFRLVDVERRCIVVAPQDCSYCALSYIWGKSKQVLLDTTNVKTLKGVNSLDLASVPKTILDAMELCRRIKQRYLWVDSLCILRDGEDNLDTQIKSMDKIYHQAFLTIVVASGNDSNAGISLLHSERSLTIHSGSFQGHDVFSAPSPQIHAEKIAESNWMSRGWTLQEYCLSRRVIIFMEDFAFFRCQKALRAETFGLASLDLAEKIPEWDLTIPTAVHEPQSKLLYPSTFQRLLSNYIYRDLTDGNDHLNAFRGILNFFESSIGTHHWGLPTIEFGVALQWNAEEANITVRRAGFPSWSWTGWYFKKPKGLSEQNGGYGLFPGVNQEKPEGGSQALHQGRQVISTVAFFAVAEDGEAKLHANQDPNFAEKLKRFARRYSKNAKMPHCFVNHFMDDSIPAYQKGHRSWPAKYHRISLPKELRHCVGFWTSYARIPVDRNPHNNVKTVTSLAKFKILLPKVDSVFVHLLPEWRNKQPDALHCIVTAVEHRGKHGIHEHRIAFWILVLETQFDESKDSAIYSRVPTSELCLQVEDWATAQPEKRFIKLV